MVSVMKVLVEPVFSMPMHAINVVAESDSVI